MSFNELSSDLTQVRSAAKHRVAKRFFDVVFSSCALIGGMPLFILIALAIKCTSPGKIFYSSKRAGKNGREFTCWKFRTMCQNAEDRLAEVLNRDPTLLHEWNTYFKLKEDPRVTRIGKLLRRTSLDEIPQFWNVLKGDLSVVGPRPYLVSEMKDLACSKSQKILSVRPGLTGLWQTSGRNKLSFEERIHLETNYVDVQSFWLDLKLICKTIPLMIFTRGAY
jgi:exopolysaccharide production protein ExoY